MSSKNQESEAGAITRPVQIATGVPGLDELLAGGLRQGGLHVVLGGPGRGKSVLAHQIGAHFIRTGGKVLYLTALVETHQTLIAQARTFRFFDPGFVPGAFYYASLYPILAKGGLQGVREEISRLVAHHGPSLVILDGVHALKLAAEGPMDYQRFMHEIEAQAAVTGMTMLVLAHPPAEGMAADPTFTIADAIFHMRARSVRAREVRTFSVGKLRGVAHISGWHTFRITEEGIRIFPRVESLADGLRRHVGGNTPTPEASSEMLDVHVHGLKEMLGGGLARASCTLVVGTPGSGKTLFGSAFLTAGAEEGEPGLMLTYHETPATLIQKADAVGLPLRKGIEDGLIHIDWRAPSQLLADEEAHRVLELCERHGIRRLAIDALEDLSQAVIPQSRILSYISSFANLLRDRGISTVILQDLARIVGVNFDMPMAELSAMMDNALHLRYVEEKASLTRLIAVIKMRAQAHDHTLRHLDITEKGMRVGKSFRGTDMVLTGLGIPR